MNTPFAQTPFRQKTHTHNNFSSKWFVSSGKIQSAWGVVYYIDTMTQQPLFLLIKRQAMSKRIERIAPKGKLQEFENAEKAALREIEEETGLLKQNLQIKQKLNTLSLQLYMDDWSLWLEKDISYFLIQYHGDPSAVKLQNTEWFLGQYVWTDIQKALNLITYRDLRELFRVAHQAIGQVNTKTSLIDKLF